MPLGGFLEGWQVGLIVAGILAGLLKSLANGKLRAAISRALTPYRSAYTTPNGGHETIVEKLECIEEKQDRTYEKIKEVSERVESVGHTVYLLHAEDVDDPNERVLRDRLGVDTADHDLWRGGGTHMGPPEDT